MYWREERGQEDDSTGPNSTTVMTGSWDLNPDSLIPMFLGPAAPPSKEEKEVLRGANWTPLLSQAHGIRLSL